MQNGLSLGTKQEREEQQTEQLAIANQQQAGD